MIDFNNWNLLVEDINHFIGPAKINNFCWTHLPDISWLALICYFDNPGEDAIPEGFVIQLSLERNEILTYVSCLRKKENGLYQQVRRKNAPFKSKDLNTMQELKKLIQKHFSNYVILGLSDVELLSQKHNMEMDQYIFTYFADMQM